MKKMMPWLITILLAITLIAVVAVILYNDVIGGKETFAAGKADSEQKAKVEQLDADDRVAVTSGITDIKTNLSGDDYIAVMGFAFQLDEKSTKEDFDKIKDIQIKPIILRTLADTTQDEIGGSRGQDALCSKLINLINRELPEGKLIKVQITNFIVTRL